MTESPSPGRRSASLPRNAKPYLPLTADATAAMSTRGHHLPALFSRRPSTIRSGGRRGSFTDDEDDIEAFGNSLMMPYDRDPERRCSSNAASILNTPQMRSQRLIGNSNPRYKW